MPETLRPTARSRTRRSVALLVLVAAFAVVAAAVGDVRPGEAQPLDLGEENSWLRIQNVGRRAATVEIEFYDDDDLERILELLLRDE